MVSFVVETVAVRCLLDPFVMAAVVVAGLVDFPDFRCARHCREFLELGGFARGGGDNCAKLLSLLSFRCGGTSNGLHFSSWGDSKLSRSI